MLDLNLPSLKKRVANCLRLILIAILCSSLVLSGCQSRELGESQVTKVTFATNNRDQASLKFLKYVLSEDFQTTWALKIGYLPINLKSQKSELYQQFVQENSVLEIFLEQMKYTRSRPIIPKYTRLSENLGRAIEAALLGDQTPEAALRRSQQRLELIFEH